MKNISKKSAILALAFAGILTVEAGAQITVLNETFDDASGFTLSTGFFSDGDSDFFGLTGGTPNFGTGAAPTGLQPFTGATDSFLVGEDLDGEGASLPIIVTWASLDISGLTALNFTGDFGASTSSIDSTDDLLVEFQIDGGGFTSLLDFDFLPNGSSFNSSFTLAGGTSPADDLGLALQSFSSSIAGTGSTLDLRLTVDLGAGNEEFAVDNFIVQGVAAVPEPSTIGLIGLGMGALFFLRRCRK